MTGNDTDIIIKRIQKFHSDYEKLEANFQRLISENPNKDIDVTGPIANAAKTVEKLLKFIIVKEGKEDKLINIDVKVKGFYELKKIVQDKIPTTQDIHITSISKFRNIAVHDNDEEAGLQELITVNSSLKAFVKWFFEEYLKDEFQDPSKNTYLNRTIVEKDFEVTSATQFNAKTDNPKPGKTPMLLKGEYITVILIVLLIASASSLFLLRSDAKKVETKSENEKLSQKEMDKDQVYVYLISYFKSLNNRNNDAHQFFADEVKQYIQAQNITPDSIDKINLANTDYIDNKFSLDKESLFSISTNNGINYWRFWIEYSCYRPSKKKFQTCKVHEEFGINNSGKITSIKEIEVVGLQYSNKKTK